ncbi:MAG: HAMP domain-containing protein [Nocardioides sp.]|nr:HAMP domain-containing protein [Nocardioides sp.]
MAADRGRGDRREQWWRAGFAARLLVSQSLVLVAGALTTWLVASFLGPGIFRDHVRRAGVAHSAAETRHVEESFFSALLISISLALLAAAAAALLVTWYMSRRVHRSIASVTDAASEIAAGRNGARVPDPGLGREFATLAATYNRLAHKLESTETTRRQMLADLAHEMRTPLATVDAHLEAVEDGIRDLDGATLGVIRTATRRLRLLAEDITAVSRAEEGHLDLTLRPVDADAVAAGAVDVVRDLYAAKGVRLLTELGAPDQVRIDPDRIGQVLGNILDNALRHTPVGGTVTLASRRIDRWIEYSVTDTGDGVPTEHLAHLFARFYRADSARDRDHGGSGIGLAIARALVDAHEGAISATSPGPGKGTTFTVRLPMAHR